MRKICWEAECSWVFKSWPISKRQFAQVSSVQFALKLQENIFVCPRWDLNPWPPAFATSVFSQFLLESEVPTNCLIDLWKTNAINSDTYSNYNAVFLRSMWLKEWLHNTYLPYWLTNLHLWLICVQFSWFFLRDQQIMLLICEKWLMWLCE